VANRLADASSAYLRQHADNPVDWYEWGPDAMLRSRSLDRPILLSIGYAACHWCHVMAHESFEDPAIAERVNENFVAIKVDREERPDIDALYMAATIAVTGHGGWPMTVFLTPDGHPFMAGTYYPPADRHGQPGFARLLDAMADAWEHQRTAVFEQAERITEAAERELTILDSLAPSTPDEDPDELDRRLASDLVARCDDQGGFGPAPKFPRAGFVEALLRRWHDGGVASAAERTLDAMSRRGLYDHIGGGFARYSVDATWTVPHFEKMLYDQALLAACYLRAARASGRGEWRDVALDTLAFVRRELDTGQGFASSLDADAGGVEGSHVTWTTEEAATALAAAGLAHDLESALSRWSIEPAGNFEGRSIPVLASGAPFTTPPELAAARRALRVAREQRPAPGRDDKVVLEWNAMTLVAFFESDVAELIDEARRRLADLHATHFHRSWWRTQSLQAHATSADLAWLIEAHVAGFEATGEDELLEPVAAIIDQLLEHYWDGPRPTAQARDNGGGLFTTSDLAAALPIRAKEVIDDATPSSQAVAAHALARFAMISGDDDALAVAERLVALGGELLARQPSVVADLARAYGVVATGREIVVPGARGELSAVVRDSFVPGSVLVTGTGRSPLLEGRLAGWAYVCRRRVCDAPVNEASELAALLGAGR
jgi:uncharacterized protein YyaL (SSP411 family)